MIANRFSKRFKFKNWPNPKLPQVAAGVYVIWYGEQLVYAGMSGREIEKAIKDGKKKYGIITRLASHANDYSILLLTILDRFFYHAP